jgi:hypothetical protein
MKALAEKVREVLTRHRHISEETSGNAFLRVLCAFRVLGGLK